MNIRIDTTDGLPVIIATMTPGEASVLAEMIRRDGGDHHPYRGWAGEMAAAVNAANP